MIAQLFELPLGLFTVWLLLVIGYWLLVVFGALDLDAFDVEVDSDADVDAQAAGGGWLAAIGLGGLPVTVAISVLSVCAWLLAAFGDKLLLGFVPGWTFGVLSGFAFVVVCTAVALLPAALLAKPLRPLFVTHEAPRKASLVGRVCTISTGHVDAGFGQASFEDGGAGFILQVRAEAGNGLERGATAVIVDYDPRDNVYQVAAYRQSAHEA